VPSTPLGPNTLFFQCSAHHYYDAEEATRRSNGFKRNKQAKDAKKRSERVNIITKEEAQRKNAGRAGTIHKAQQ
jgi:hypothetical protein